MKLVKSKSSDIKFRANSSTLLVITTEGILVDDYLEGVITDRLGNQVMIEDAPAPSAPADAEKPADQVTSQPEAAAPAEPAPSAPADAEKPADDVEVGDE